MLTLTDLLSGNRHDLHTKWKRVFTDPVFRHQPGRSHHDSATHAYRAMRHVNSAIPSVRDTVTDHHELTVLQQWAAMLDPGLVSLIAIHYNLFLGTLLDLDPHKQIDPDPYLNLDQVGAYLLTELGHGNDAAQLETTATYNPDTDTFDLHTPTDRARKFMPNTSQLGAAKTALVAARLITDGHDNGVFFFHTPLHDETGTHPGVRIQPLPEKPAYPVDNSVTWFHHVTLPRDAWLAGDHGEITSDGAFRSRLASRSQRFAQSITRLNHGRLCLSGVGVGVMQLSTTVAVRYAHRRHVAPLRGTTPVTTFSYRCNQTRLLSAVATTYAATMLLRGLTDDGPHNDTQLAAAKSWITWQARDTAVECRERCGAQGMLPVNRIVDAITTAEAAITAEGDNLVLAAKAGADLLTSRYAPPDAEPSEDGSLTDTNHLITLLTRHEQRTHHRAKHALRGTASGPTGVWNNAVNPALEFVDAHTTRRAAEALVAASHQVGEHDRTLLGLLTRLFTLNHIAPHTGAMLADGDLSSEHVTELPDLLDQTAAELAPHAQRLVDAFAIPDDILQAPVATGTTDDYTTTFTARHLPPLHDPVGENR